MGGDDNIGGTKRTEILGMAVIARMETIKQIYLEDMIRSEEKYLIDFNYTVEKVISSSTFNKMNEWIMMLELYLKDNKTGLIEKV